MDRVLIFPTVFHRASKTIKTTEQLRPFIVLLSLEFMVCGGWAEGVPEPPLIWYGVVRNNVGGQDVRLTSGTLTWEIQDGQGAVAASLKVTLTNIHDQFSYVLEVPCETVLAGMTAAPGVLTLNQSTGYLRHQVSLDGQLLFLQGGSPESFTMDVGMRGELERVDLALARADLDSDGDGLPDWWEDQYFPGVGTDPNADSDGDGVTDGNEYRAGTDPTDPNSLFKITIGLDETGAPVVTWQSVEGKSYRILRATTLSLNPGDFAEVASGIGATPPTNEYVDTGANGEGSYFYLLQLEE